MLIGLRTSFDLSKQSEKEAAYEQLINALGDKSKGSPVEGMLLSYLHIPDLGTCLSFTSQ